LTERESSSRLVSAGHPLSTPVKHQRPSDVRESEEKKSEARACGSGRRGLIVPSARQSDLLRKSSATIAACQTSPPSPAGTSEEASSAGSTAPYTSAVDSLRRRSAGRASSASDPSSSWSTDSSEPANQSCDSSPRSVPNAAEVYSAGWPWLKYSSSSSKEEWLAIAASATLCCGMNG